MSADGLAVGLIESNLNNFSTSNLERVDDFTLLNTDNDTTLNLSPNEEGDTLEVFLNDAHVKSIVIPKPGEDTQDFHKAITQQVISFVNV